MVTRTRLVAKIEHFSPQNDGENGFRRQKIEFSGLKRRREWGSSQKSRVSRLKTTTRTGLVAKK
ncbi:MULTISPECIES: hypothetical protein [Bacillaceae]|uniref:hypothetical protein n=1 Tax=Bacillaceae TaxID=186817 RepID=UPI0012698D2B|nr:MULTISPECIES: hypothetical protein [Bacillaceae]MED4850819.1 hypothetical protein [Caldifermentibacillus hisashii]